MLWRRLADSIALQRLQNKRDRWEADYRRQMKAALSRHDHIELDRLAASRRFDLRVINDEIAYLESRRLLKRAERLMIPRPDFDEISFVESKVTGSWHLSSEAMTTLRARVRAESKARSTPILAWISAATGFVGALIGLAAVILDGG